MKYIIEYEMDMKRGTFKKEKYPVEKEETETIYDMYGGAYSKESMKSAYFYRKNGQVKRVGEERLNHTTFLVSEPDTIQILCLQDEFVSEKNNDAFVQVHFSNILKSNLRNINQAYESYVKDYKKKVEKHSALEEELLSLTEEKDMPNDEMEL